MSESPTASPTTSKQEQPVTAPAAADQPRGDNGQFKKPGDEWGEHVELDPDAQKKFNRIYGALKHNQNLNEQLLNDNVTLAARLEALEKNVFETEGQRTEAQLKATKINALRMGDFEKAAEVDDKLMEIRLEAMQKKQPPASQTPAAMNYELDKDSSALLDSWGAEKDGKGGLLRPWVMPDHPLHEKANRAHQVVMADPMTSFAPLPDVLDAIDRLMGVAQPKTRPTPGAKPAQMAAVQGVTTPPQRSAASPALNAQQIYIAKKMFRGDPDPIGRYRRAMASHG